MPELPEVETVKETLKKSVLNLTINAIDIHYPKIIENDQDEFITTFSNQKIINIDRVGKYLIFIFEEVAFISHLRMEGKYNLVDQHTLLSKHDHIVFHLDNGMELRYHDTRKFGRIEMVDRKYYRNKLPLSKLGDEPFFANPKKVHERLLKTALPIKTVLLDQTIMAGIGNIYANEICFYMNIIPTTPANKLSLKRVEQLIEIAATVLQKAIDQGGTTIHSFSTGGIDGLFQVQLAVHGQKVCKVCGQEITKKMVNQRGTYYCKKCQRRRT